MEPGRLRVSSGGKLRTYISRALESLPVRATRVSRLLTPFAMVRVHTYNCII